MPDTELDQFERQARKRVEEFLNPEIKRQIHTAAPTTQGLTVKLAVREKRLAMDQVFVYHSTSISRLEAQIEAEQAARDAGWPIIGFLIDIQQRKP